MANPVREEMRRWWRMGTGEHNPNIPPDTDVDDLLQSGLEALNDVVEYHFTDDTTGVTFVDGTQEYTLPTDVIRLEWVKWNGKLLEPSDQDDLRANKQGWNTKPGPPTHQYQNGRSLGFYPIPDAATVAQAASPVLRYLSTPADFGVSATVAQLATQHRRIPVFWAIAEWFAGRGANPAKSKEYLELFKIRAAAAVRVYEQRRQRK